MDAFEAGSDECAAGVFDAIFTTISIVIVGFAVR
jgi:hypothetical protein